MSFQHAPFLSEHFLTFWQDKMFGIFPVPALESTASPWNSDTFFFGQWYLETSIWVLGGYTHCYGSFIVSGPFQQRQPGNVCL